MPVLAAWPPAARIVGAVVDDVGTVVGETGTDLLVLLQGGQRVIRVRRIGGTDDRVTDIARIDVRVYAVDLSNAEVGSESVRQCLLSGPVATAHGVLDRAETEVGPQEVPSPDPENYRVVSATYRVSVRRR
ncbi:hypothetical protein [Actinomadura rubrisoli]|uniref:DUF3168 domain-containing protein n=1 Tax=Actinomadura rubrisoli TaxID=2530368 RepID=A0A4R5CH69_9ACTN|nr:hypothetical protein [Actinomadura rubrisoli]TDD97643.1 hypothetical protein E1298_01010 [Actinomadura rubrisoli]